MIDQRELEAAPKLVPFVTDPKYQPGQAERVELLAQRFAAGLDLWTGEPLPASTSRHISRGGSTNKQTERRCPKCGVSFVGIPIKKFCSTACYDAFQKQKGTNIEAA